MLYLKNKRLDEPQGLLGSLGTDVGGLFSGYVMGRCRLFSCWVGVYVQVVVGDCNREDAMSQTLDMMYRKGDSTSCRASFSPVKLKVKRHNRTLT